MPTWLHAFVQHTNDLDQPRPHDMVVEDVHRSLDRGFRLATAGVTDVKAANTGEQVSPALCQQTRWITRHLPHCRRKDRGVTAPTFDSPPLFARREDVREICSRRFGETKARH